MDAETLLLFLHLVEYLQVFVTLILTTIGVAVGLNVALPIFRQSQNMLLRRSGCLVLSFIFMMAALAVGQAGPLLEFGSVSWAFYRAFKFFTLGFAVFALIRFREVILRGDHE